MWSRKIQNRTMSGKTIWWRSSGTKMETWYQEQDVVVGGGGSINSGEEQIDPLRFK